MKTYKWKFPVMFAHCDVAGTVFYPHFYTWFDQGTERLFAKNQLSYADLKREFNVVGMPVVETGAKYLNACRLGDELEISTCVDEWARKTFLVRHQITHADGRVAVEGFERRVWAIEDASSANGIRAMEIPQSAIERLKS
jgi:4-hydroxybenzoyl-CoA thioesterase